MSKLAKKAGPENDGKEDGGGTTPVPGLPQDRFKVIDLLVRSQEFATVPRNYHETP
ncbi:MAG: hypothetical protein WBL72_10155 [Thermoguttaceae bacterium]|jgi:hypothetical protein